MSRTALFSLLVVLSGLATPSTATAESIPPNCTLDPFTGKMNCPVPKKATTTMSRSLGD